jgi:hypothetical protein
MQVGGRNRENDGHPGCSINDSNPASLPFANGVSEIVDILHVEETVATKHGINYVSVSTKSEAS